MSNILSKTDYILFRECPKNAWYKIQRPKIYFESELSEFEKAIMETGDEVELVARQLFPTGILIEGRDKNAQKHVQDYMSKSVVTLFQPTFVKDGFLATLDILKFDPKNNTCSVYEVKSTNSIDSKTHYHDLAFQVNLLKKMRYKIDTANIIHLNSEYIRSGAIDVTKLFKIEDVTSEIESLFDVVNKEMDEALEYISKEVEPKGYCCCIYKGRSKHCATFKHSNPQVPGYSIHDIARIGNSKAKLQEMVDIGVFELENIPEHIKLSNIQKNQVEAYVLDKTIIQEDKILEEFKNLSFPLHFLDYETYPCAIPRFDKFASYQQIPFQYSLHVLDSVGAELKHFEFLYTDSSDPSFEFINSIKENIGDSGTIIVWSKRFECKINMELAKRLPKFKAFIDSINLRVFDLMDIFGKQYYVHKDFHGKISIKSILPVLIPELSYEKLDIQEGGTASQRWNNLTIGDISDSKKEETINNLKEYCRMDTFAMHAIWEKLNKIV